MHKKIACHPTYMSETYEELVKHCIHTNKSTRGSTGFGALGLPKKTLKSTTHHVLEEIKEIMDKEVKETGRTASQSQRRLGTYSSWQKESAPQNLDTGHNPVIPALELEARRSRVLDGVSFETGFHYIALAVLELTINQAGLKLKRSAFLCLPSARIKDMCHHAQSRTRCLKSSVVGSHSSFGLEVPTPIEVLVTITPTRRGQGRA